MYKTPTKVRTESIAVSYNLILWFVLKKICNFMLKKKYRNHRFKLSDTTMLSVHTLVGVWYILQLHRLAKLFISWEPKDRLYAEEKILYTSTDIFNISSSSMMINQTKNEGETNKKTKLKKYKFQGKKKRRRRRRTVSGNVYKGM